MRYRAFTLRAIAASVLLALTTQANAQAPAASVNPVGEFTVTMREGGTQAMGALTIVSRQDTLGGRIAIPGQGEVAFASAAVTGRTVTLSGRSDGNAIVLVLTFDSDSAFSGSWSIGAQRGTITGTRGLHPSLIEPTCPADSADTTAALDSSLMRQPSANPDSARIITSDVRLFWAVVDRSTPATLPQLLHCEYIRGGTQAVRDFIPYRIISAHRLAEMVTARRARYDAARQSSLALDTLVQPVRVVFHRMKALYPDAVFPDVYFVIGRLNTGGTTSPRGLLIGAEMYRNHSDIPHIIAHELVHYQQTPIPEGQRTLLAQSIMEGSADFVAELISGRHINERAHAYALPRERELWQEFSGAMHGQDLTGWLYGNPPEGRPADIGYFFGYRIAQAYYARTPDKSQALRDILSITDYGEFWIQSGYDPLADQVR